MKTSMERLFPLLSTKSRQEIRYVSSDATAILACPILLQGVGLAHMANVGNAGCGRSIDE